MNKVQEVWDSFNRKDDKFTCKSCSKMIKIDNIGNGTLSVEQRTFLILAMHKEKDCK